VLAETQAEVNKQHAGIHLRLAECWYRIHQVLPMRTHPTMQMNGAGGYLFTGYKVAGNWAEDEKIVPSSASAPATNNDEDAMNVDNDDGNDRNDDADADADADADDDDADAEPNDKKRPRSD
jgi:hypothetical protein